MVVVTCPKHGDFTVRANNHLLGVGCKQCGIDHVANCTRVTFDEIVLRSHLKHESHYKYIEPTTPITDQSFKLDIVCPIHGVFKCSVSNHFSGKGCPVCAIDATRMTQEYFLEGAAKLEREVLYDYSEAIVVDSKNKVKIICPQHGPFWQSPASHLQGYGCPSCAVSGFKSNKPGIFYVLQDGDTTKVGITNDSLSRRVRTINKSGPNFIVIATFKFENGQAARDLETKFLRHLRSQYEQPTEKFDGYTECFYGVDINKLLSEIQLSEVPSVSSSD